MGRRLIKVAAAVVVLAVVLVALAPTLVNAGLAQGAIRSAIEEQVNGTVKFASLDVGWGGPQRVGELLTLSGRLDDLGEDWAIIDVQGVGYLVHCSAKTLSALGERGEACTVHTDLQVSENDMRLLGFAESAERDWFRLMTQVQRVGNKVS